MYRTTLFPDWRDEKKNALASFLNDTKSDARKKSGGDPDSQQQDEGQRAWVPPISMMAIVGYTRTQASQDPTGSPYKPNNNLVASPVSLFYGGAITEHVGAFAQVTWNNAPFGAPDQFDPFATRQVTWDNTDVRYANNATLGGVNVSYGITANNNPTVQDPWNTTPAWSFPYNSSNVAPRPATSTLIDGALAQHVAGAGAYALVNDILYLELTGYRTINYDAQLKLGPDPFKAPGMNQGIMPYWRVAIEPHWGNHWLEFGTFGMSAQIHPWNIPQNIDPNTNLPIFYQNVTFPQTDKITDTAFDAQYQYQGPNYWFTLRGTYIHENQHLDSSSINLGTNPTNTLNTFRGYASLAYGNDNRVVLTGQYFDTKGSSDATLYGGLASQFDPSGTPPTDPNSNGYIFDISYIPFISSQSPIWPWANMRVGLQYTYYNKFDGDTVFAKKNNTLFAYLWFAM